MQRLSSFRISGWIVGGLLASTLEIGRMSSGIIDDDHYIIMSSDADARDVRSRGRSCVLE